MTPWVLRLMIANVVMMLMVAISPAITTALMFVPAYVLFRPWTILSYMFLHAGWSHLFFNMLGLFFFGPRLELELGGKNFLWLYFISGVMGALLSFVLSPMTAIVGASGAVYGVMLGFAFYWPKEPMYVYGLMPVQSRYLIIVMTLLSVYGGFGGSADGIAHFAHLGGFAGGYLFLRLINRKTLSATHANLPASPSVSQNDLSRWSRIQRDQLHPVNREELDRILHKLNSTGITSLTPIEMEFLNRFSQDQ